MKIFYISSRSTTSILFLQIFTNDSKVLIWKVEGNTLEEFKDTFYRNTENMKEADTDLYFERIVHAYIDKYMSWFEGNFRILADSLFVIAVT